MAQIAFDLRALNGISRYRGIGMYTVEVANRILPNLLDKHSVTLFAVSENDLSDIEPELLAQCRVMLATSPETKIPLGPISKITEDVVPGSMNVNISLPDLDTIDVFWQPYFYFGSPNSPRIKTIMVAYDFIPLVFLEQFFGRVHMRRHKLKQVALNARRKIRLASMQNAIRTFESAFAVLAISENTRRDVALFTKTKLRNVHVTLLGPPEITRSKKTRLPKDLKGAEFIFYIGGIDYRRDLLSLIVAFEETKKTNPKLRLVLAGKDFEDIRDVKLASAIRTSPYSEDILNLGFVSNDVRQALYEHAQACVYPTLYEGFGLPILESFTFGCPIITNKNSSTPEVGGNAAVYATGARSLAQSINTVLKMSSAERTQLIAKGKQRAEQFSWDRCAEETLAVFEKALE